MLNDKLKYYVLSSEEKNTLLEKLKNILHGLSVELAVVFGSFVELDSFRDIDIAVYRRDTCLEDILKLGTMVEEALGYPVDIIPLDIISPRFRLHILTKGIVILEETSGLYEYLLKRSLDELKP
ncbi:MAG: nucleotidyltransferase domain-containing protein [Thaumarchaeota archaeon]|jgi:predicted nucleotidyltransferase|nr:nucleotidyltransferase domain-containing protein [Candidatus Geocrenenecus arthurdayi]MCL7388464.1 nucleotidyltransferase domain-containing protein [Candidatus Geocrenenecus arthurdayi]MCL7390835.1 nucleotidyltransferase domain-containing protein [Candidatus Geocrenenecus arthurdayi]MCL7396199.1 nucleotidyltransferase domain-containing protein [Candidatus Geocrenenecus arthurdayi]MCL7403080.1 nucleotidyltransferase domain-containing protein [Candidatus Geocrenenecus arthurdayi]